LLEISVDTKVGESLPLSKITEEIRAIELELTNESIINPQPNKLKRIILTDDHVFLAQTEKIFVFDRNGKFIHSIGSKGQGPGEYNEIRNFAIDETNKRLFVNTFRNIICYDFTGKFLKESPKLNSLIYDINYSNDELLIIVDYLGMDPDRSKQFSRTLIYNLNDDFQVTDSCFIKLISGSTGFSGGTVDNYILSADSVVYIYYPNATSQQIPSKTFLRDTLYRYKHNQLVPDLKLKFKRDGVDSEGNLFIYLINLYRSSRYVFADYYDYSLELEDDYWYVSFNFCYDTKTGERYKMGRDRYRDDIHDIDPVIIYPFHTNPEMFYYLHTHMKPDDLEEPNPTLYIGKLKK